jgi:hypothetical protein
MKSKALTMRRLVILGIVSLVFLAGCGGGTSQSSNNQSPSPSGSNPTPNPIPMIRVLSPNNTAAGGPAFALTVDGSNFVCGARKLIVGDTKGRDSRLTPDLISGYHKTRRPFCVRSVPDPRSGSQMGCLTVIAPIWFSSRMWMA